MGITAGELIREARKRRGLSQARLAIRAGTTQSVISRIEQDRVSPSVETVEKLLQLMGEELVLETRDRNSGIDRSQVRERLRMTPQQRVEYGIAFVNSLLGSRAAV
jgi:transcriptional regulator with XRE-family HTH domain